MSVNLLQDWKVPARAVVALLAVGAMAACSSPMSNSRRFSDPPATLPPVQNSTVSTTNLPPINGQTQTQTGGGYYTQDGTYVPAGTSTVGQNGLLTTPDGRIVTSGQLNSQTGFPGGNTTMTANNDGSFVSQDPMLNGGGFNAGVQTQDQQIAIDPTGQPTQVATRDLSGGVTQEKLLGTWTVVSGSETCRVNLTQTAASGTQRFRASAPNCTIPVLSDVASWQLAGSQVQFFSEGGELIAALLQSGNRFIGTLSGGRGISMAG